MKNYVKNGMKAVVAAGITVLSSLGTVLVGPAGFGSLTDGQWVAIAGAGLASLATVYGIRNVPLPPAPAAAVGEAAPAASPAPAGGTTGG